MQLRVVLLLAALLFACGDDKKGKPPEPKIEIPTLTMPALGVASVKQMGYPYGDGKKAYDKAVAAYKKKDWAAVKTSCEEALAKDPHHLDAHRVLGTALAKLGDFEGASKHLVAALAGDFLRWGPKLLEDEELAEYLASPHGKALFALHGELKAKIDARITDGVWLLGRRGAFKWPSKPGSQWAATRGELYAWGEAEQTFVRLTHTDHEVAAWLPSPGGDEIAIVGYDKAEMPDPKAKNAAALPPLLGKVWVDTLDSRTFEPKGKRASFSKVRGVSVSWGEGGQLLVDTLKPSGRWALAIDARFSVDRATGKTAKSQAKSHTESGWVRVTLDESVAAAPLWGLAISASPADPSLATEVRVESTGRTITIPESGLSPAGMIQANPARTRIAFSTWADPCAKDGAKPSIYVADAKTGQLKHILTAPSRFGLRWRNDDTLIYEDDAGSLRIWDAATGRETLKVAEKAGLALYGLSSTTKPICRKEPEIVEPDDGTDQEPEGDPVDEGLEDPGPPPPVP
jgi:hypothetical protein